MTLFRLANELSDFALFRDTDLLLLALSQALPLLSAWDGRDGDRHLQAFGQSPAETLPWGSGDLQPHTSGGRKRGYLAWARRSSRQSRTKSLFPRGWQRLRAAPRGSTRRLPGYCASYLYAQDSPLSMRCDARIKALASFPSRFWYLLSFRRCHGPFAYSYSSSLLVIPFT